MKCPNCGRKVRSTNQCAFCGHVFNETEVHEMKQEESQTSSPNEQSVESNDEDYLYEEEVPRSSRGGVGSILWNIAKAVLAVAAVFLAFMYGPDLYSSIGQWFNKSEPEVEELVSHEENMEEVAELEEEKATLNLTDHQVNLDYYPTIELTLDLEGDLDDVDQETFNFTINQETDPTPVTDYSLFQVEDQFMLSFEDPTLAVAASDNKQQRLTIDAPDFNFIETVEYRLPNVTYDQAFADEVKQIVDEELGALGEVSLVFQPLDAKMPYTYNPHSVEASSLISWFIIQRTYQAIHDGEIDFDSIVRLSEEEIDAIEETAEESIGSEREVSDLLLDVVSRQDVAAMNHLIELTGGASSFNLWLKQTGYLATQVSSQLTLLDGTISGATTSTQDVAKLLQRLNSDELVGNSEDEAMKELLLNTPITDKYPDLEDVTRRYELASQDDNPIIQNYSAIYETDEQNYLIVLTVKPNSTVDEELIEHIAATIESLVDTAQNGPIDKDEDDEDDDEDEETDEEVAEAEEEANHNSQVSLVQDDVPAQPAPQAPAADTSHYSSNMNQAYVEEMRNGNFVYENGDRGTATSIYLTELGYSIPVTWVQEGDSTWMEPGN